MNASIVLDQPSNIAFTNLDLISGKVVLKCAKSTDLTSIVVKLEGESRTRLLSVAAPGEKQKPRLEYHKMVFPTADFMSRRSDFARNAMTISPGTHEYPFAFKTQSPTMNLSGSGVEFSKAPTRHVKKTLPPTLSGFPGEAEIRYFLKATVSRHYFWKENPRVYVPFNFFPIEPPRAPVSGGEVYARQKHSFNQFTDFDAKTKMKNLFSKSKEATSPAGGNEPPRVSIDARLPEPAILTCNEDIPLRLLVEKLNDSNGTVFLQSLEIGLVGNTKIRAHEVWRTESTPWIIMSKSNMGMPIGSPSDAADTETVIDSRLWRGLNLPSAVAPSFITCNIERTYHLDIRVGLSYTGTSSSVLPKPQTVVLPLRLDVEVYSGIAPPKALLEAMAEAKASMYRKPSVVSVDKLDTKLNTKLSAESTHDIPPTPMEPSGSHAASKLPAYQGSTVPQGLDAVHNDAPPSYEDAIASTLPPVDAHRPDYQPPPTTGEDDVLRGDEKKSIFGRRDS